MSSNEDVIASVVESQTDGQLEAEVGQDEGTNNEEGSTTDWEAHAKYHQSEKDKLYAEHTELKAKVQEFLDSRTSEQPAAPEKNAPIKKPNAEYKSKISQIKMNIMIPTILIVKYWRFK